VLGGALGGTLDGMPVALGPMRRRWYAAVAGLLAGVYLGRS
jgi:hypothetical protein